MPDPSESEQKPDDFIFGDIPRTKKEKFAASAEARVTETVKSALQSYLKRYLDKNGVHRKQLNITANFTVNYETRISGPTSSPRDSDDPTVYQIQLERYWGELRQRLPAILIIDTGFEHTPAGLGGITDSRFLNDSLSQVELSMLATIPIELQIAAMDQTTCSDLRDALMYVFGVLTHLNKGHLIRSERTQDRWEVRLPLTYSSSGLDRRNVGDDPKDVFWSTSIGLEVVFEGLSAVAFDRQVQLGEYPDGDTNIGWGPNSAGRLGIIHQVSDQYTGVDPLVFRASDGACVPFNSSYRFSDTVLDSIEVPDCIGLHQAVPITADWLPARSYFRSDNPRIAIVDRDTCTIHAKRPGCFTLNLYDPDGPKVLRSWEVTVKIR